MAEGDRQVRGTSARATGDAPAALLALMDELARVSRQMHPPRVPALAASVQPAAAALRQMEADLRDAPLRDAASLALRACDALRDAGDADNPIMEAYRAMRLYQRALACLVAAEHLPTVSRFLLPPALRDDPAVHARLAEQPAEGTGVTHHANDVRERGGYSVYVPPFCRPDQSWPVVVALHGGSGHGSLFLSNWVPLARARGFLVIAPTSTGSTWSLMEPEVDAEHLSRVLATVSGRWRVDRSHLLLTGMSDGGTFTLLSGLDEDSPFTHLGPVAASFHPLLAAMAAPRRLTGLPIYLVHGALDWMFPVSVGRTAHRTLADAGAAIVYREVADLSHTYPTDEQGPMFDWFVAASPPVSSL